MSVIEDRMSGFTEDQRRIYLLQMIAINAYAAWSNVPDGDWRSART